MIILKLQKEGNKESSTLLAMTHEQTVSERERERGELEGVREAG